MVAPSRKREALRLLLERDGTGPTLVFTRTKARANQLVRYLDTSDRRVAAIHANKSQSARTRALARFREGALDTLIATDIAARGIDVDDISHVINFDLPHVPEDYVHRIGRTARAGRAGHALALATPEDGAKLAANRTTPRTDHPTGTGGRSRDGRPHGSTGTHPPPRSVRRFETPTDYPHVARPVRTGTAVAQDGVNGSM